MRPLLLALRERVTEELDRLQAEGIIVPVKFSKWATPIVPVVKNDRSIRICGDFKRTVNKSTRTEIYPLPRIEELFTCLSGGQTFTTLDLPHVYLQLELEEDSQELVTINAFTSIRAFRLAWCPHQQFSNELWSHCYKGYQWCVFTSIIL